MPGHISTSCYPGLNEAHATVSLLMLLPALTTLWLAWMHPPVTQHQHTLFRERTIARAWARLQNPVLTGSFHCQRTLSRTAAKAFRNSIAWEVTTSTWSSGDPLLSSSSIAKTFCAILGGEKGKKKNLTNFFLSLFVPPICCFCIWGHCMHYQPVSQKLVRGFHSNISKKDILKTIRKCDK